MTQGYREFYRRVLEDLCERLKEFYGPRLVSVAVFGSVARGTFRPDSDIDLLVVARALPRGRRRRVEEFISGVEEPLERIWAERGQPYLPEITPLIKTPEEVRLGSPVFLDMTEEALILYDPEGFLQEYLEDLRRKLKALGARRVFSGGGWYWILKPDYRPGEVIEL
ncbi:nucleotidyltransferase domain-containing protein [Thermosulfurimonas marina]|uniref:Nucleotidyltransferase domain-containing protein n=1 Tax=Thermosulfurimonas marina TaxID=2047767 RepID=A0A6H1WSQ0_9BACT|nr:nucleotidyltransferase domain-containing protein [Thermosulfurimonas marina]QJA06247.1 nucleotidyltransferase domain-containing protein [Thermosulfurimonas marina]